MLQVVHRMRLHIWVEIGLLLEITSRLRSSLLRGLYNLTRLRSCVVFSLVSVVSLVELLCGVLLVVVRIVPVLVTWMFRVALLAIPTGFNIFSIRRRNAWAKARSRLSWNSSDSVSWVNWLRFSLASNSSLVFLSDILIRLIHLLTFWGWLLGRATSASTCSTA